MHMITLEIKDEIIDKLKKDFDSHLRISRELDPLFSSVRFEDYLGARLRDASTPMTERQVEQILKNSEYAWAKKSAQKDGPNVIGDLIKQAGNFGFGFALRSEWTSEERAVQCRKWASAIIEEANGDPSLVESLVRQLNASVHDIQTLEALFETPAWRLLQALRVFVIEAQQRCRSTDTALARSEVGELRALLRLAVIHGAMDVQEAQ
ncbi:Protein of unknown function (DUF4088) [Paraburkholderia caribensis MBA4]|uniref:Uncharacterized protein n=1 Tax=Paraburkholderia caribensis MBA4 TaxID=1323664 RepID=A0A0P0RJJ5_9BURK|nr:Protein of unknown function (DUF4088) [Paraburkholderia caribensis MBA4]